MSILDDHKVSITCDKCGRKFEKTVREINSNPKISCPGCGNASDTKRAKATLKETNKPLEGVSKAIEDLKRKLR